MTTLDNNSYHAIIAHQSAIEALCCFSSLIPCGDDLKPLITLLTDNLGDTWRRMPVSISATAKSGVPLGSDLVVADTQD